MKFTFLTSAIEKQESTGSLNMSAKKWTEYHISFFLTKEYSAVQMAYSPRGIAMLRFSVSSCEPSPPSCQKQSTLPKRWTNCFNADAYIMLLFLQLVESMELYVREDSESNSRRIFQVKLAEKCLQTVRTRRKEFYENIKPGIVMTTSITVNYPITIETLNLDPSSANTTKQHLFLVSNYFCDWQVSSMFKTLMTDHDLSYIPAVSVAMVLLSNPSTQAPAFRIMYFVLCVCRYKRLA